MRGYKRQQSALNASGLLAWCGNHLGHGGAHLALLVAGIPPDDQTSNDRSEI